MVDLESISIEQDNNSAVIKVKSYPPLHHFYHIYCGNNYAEQDGAWISPVTLHIEALKSSGLLNYINTVQIGLVGLHHQRDQAKQLLLDSGINHVVVVEAESGWEQVTQVPLYNFAQTNNGYVLYAHTKGSFNNTDQNIGWCKLMTDATVVNWRNCLEKLEHVDAVGRDWHDFSQQHGPHLGGPHVGQKWFAGTFWWAKLNRIKDIGHIPTMHTRWDAEVWIGQIPDITVHNITEW